MKQNWETKFNKLDCSFWDFDGEADVIISFIQETLQEQRTQLLKELIEEFEDMFTDYGNFEQVNATHKEVKVFLERKLLDK